MTRETKIGLLVGLAFIIVVAILLTDHTSTTTESKPAAQSDIGDSVRQSVAAPQSQIPTRADLARPPVEAVKSPVQIVQTGPDVDGKLVDIRQTNTDQARVPPTVADAGATNRGPISDLVRQHPDELMEVGIPGQATPPAKSSPTPPVIAPKTYVATAGDSVSRIAARMMPGGNTTANRDALIKANPALQADGNPVFVGRTYVIPSTGAVAQASDSTRKDAAQRDATPSFKKPPASTPSTYWYTVKENDNLWRIAASELGNGNLWYQIKELNGDVLKGNETVRPNQRIRLPRNSASTASVN